MLGIVLLLAVLSWDLALVPRRVGLGGVVGCLGCLGYGCARAEVEIKQEMPLSRGRQDEEFARGMAFGTWTNWKNLCVH